MKQRSIGILIASVLFIFLFFEISPARGRSEPLPVTDNGIQSLEDKIAKIDDQIKDWENVIKSWKEDYGERKSTFLDADIIYTGWSDKFLRPYVTKGKDNLRYLMFAMHLDKYYGYWLNVDPENWARIRINAIAEVDKMWKYVLEVDSEIRQKEGESLAKIAKHIQEAEAGLEKLKRQKESFEAELDKKLGLGGEPEATALWEQPVTEEDLKTGEEIVKNAFQEWIRLRTNKLNEERRKRNQPAVSVEWVEKNQAYDLKQVRGNLAGPLQKEAARHGKAGWAEWKKLVSDVTSCARKAPLGGDPFHIPRSVAIGDFRERCKKYPFYPKKD